MIHFIVDLINILLRGAQNDIFKKQMEGVVIGFHCTPFPMQRWVVHQSKLQYLYRFAVCDLEISGNISQWLALLSQKSSAHTPGCQLKGETAYLQGLKEALDKQSFLYQDYLDNQIPAPVRSLAYHLRQMIISIAPEAPFLQRNDFEQEQQKLKKCFEILNKIERTKALILKRESDV